MANKLTIKISGDPKEYQAAIRQVQAENDQLADSAIQATKIAGIAFAALSAEVFFSVKAFNEEAQALEEVSQALQNQGLYTDDLAKKYRKVADEIEYSTGINADAISTAQAQAQATVGQIELTDELTRAVVDFAAKNKTDVRTSYDLVAKAIAGNVGALSRYGVFIDEGLSKQERLQQISEKLTIAVGGFAEAQANAAGSTKLLGAEVGNLQKDIGRRLAPAFDAVVAGLTNFIRLIRENKAVLDLSVSLIAGATAAAAVATTLGSLLIAYTKIRAVIIAATAAQATANLVFGASAPTAIGSLTGAFPALLAALKSATIGTKILVGATGLGLLVVIATEIYLNWNSIFPRIQAIWDGFVTAIVGSAKALGLILEGVFTGNPKLILEGIQNWKKAYVDGFKEATKEIKSIEVGTPTDQDPSKAKAAGKQAALDRAKDRAIVEGARASNELIRLESEKASNAAIELKKREIELLKRLETEGNLERRALIVKQLEETRKLEDEQVEIDRERRQVLNEELLASNEEFQQLTEEQKRQFVERNQTIVEEGILTERTAQEQAAKDTLATQIKTNNEFLLNQRKFGTAYALINKAMHSAIYEGTKSAFGELAALQQSSNNTLKSIGKVAAIANITIRSAEAAMNIYAGFSTIPIIGPALGIAGAAAALAFGVEQIGKVRGAQDGGLVTGGVRGRDSVPFMLTPGELVVPERNFEEVVGATRAARGDLTAVAGGNNPVNDRILAELEVLNQTVENLGRPNVTFEGDILSDQNFIDRIIRGVSDAIEFRGARIVGVNA